MVCSCGQAMFTGANGYELCPHCDLIVEHKAPCAPCRAYTLAMAAKAKPSPA